MRDIGQAERRKNGGFSLIELSIVLIVMGLIFVPFIKAYDIYQGKKRADDTKIALSLVNTAISNFYSQNGYYPCPADRSLGFDDLGHGREQCGNRIIPPATVATPAAGFQLMTTDACQSGRGYCRATNAGGAAVYIGAVPYVTLDIPAAHAIDGWKNTLTYAVTATMTDRSTFDPNLDAVEIISEHAGSPVSLVHGILFSSGSDGVGAFNTQGQVQPCTTGMRESENCDDNARFMASVLYEAPGATYYDDYYNITDWSTTNIWAYADSTRIHNTNGGNIGIGTDNPLANLEVVGSVRSSQNMQSPEFCDTDYTTDPLNPAAVDCFDAAKIGGDGMTCDTSIGEVATGISYEHMDCRAPNVAFGNCPANQYVYGIAANGAVLCRPF